MISHKVPIDFGSYSSKEGGGGRLLTIFCCPFAKERTVGLRTLQLTSMIEHRPRRAPIVFGVPRSKGGKRGGGLQAYLAFRALKGEPLDLEHYNLPV